MPRAAVTWVEGAELRYVPVAGAAPTVIGRSAEAAVRIEKETTVSREHARIAPDGGGFALEHLSRTNPTRLNGDMVADRQALADRNTIEVGTLTLTFHDLKAAAREMGVPCHHCTRENPLGQHDCWYCGSSLVNAPTITGRQMIVCRVIGRDGVAHDLTASNTLLLDAEGAATLAVAGAEVEGTTAILPRGDSVVAAVSETALVTMNGARLDAERTLASGDVVTTVDGSDYLCILREG